MLPTAMLHLPRCVLVAANFLGLSITRRVRELGRVKLLSYNRFMRMRESDTRRARRFRHFGNFSCQDFVVNGIAARVEWTSEKLS